jgi:hypothetical protein
MVILGRPLLQTIPSLHSFPLLSGINGIKTPNAHLPATALTLDLNPFNQRLDDGGCQPAGEHG